MNSLLPSAAHAQDGPWLLIDRAQYSGDWGVGLNSKGMIATATQMQLLPRKAPVTQDDPPRLVVLLVSGNDNYELNLLPNLVEALESQPQWNAWCHFGGNISLSGERGYARLWEQWTGLSGQSKDWVKRAHAGRPPLPFSHSLGFSWSKEIAGVKKLVSDATLRKPMTLTSEEWQRIADLLHVARVKADSRSSLDALNRAVHETFPAVLLAQSMGAAMGDLSGDSYDIASMLVGVDGRGGLFHSCGFEDHAEAFDFKVDVYGISQLKKHYDDIRKTVVSLREIMMTRSDNFVLSKELTKLHSAIADLGEVQLNLSAKATELLHGPVSD